MFIGHYGPAVWDTQRGHTKPLLTLWQGFIAVQAMDFTAGLLTVFGLEGTEMVNDVPLFHIPWSHSLLGAIVIAVLAGFLFRALKPDIGKKGFWVVALLAFSHWPLDLLVHRPDLPLYPGGGNLMGFSLWDYAWPSFMAEVLLLGGAMAWWLKVTRGPAWTALATVMLFFFMCALHYGAITMVTLQVQAGSFDPSTQPQGPISGVIMIAVLALFAGLIALIERKRVPAFSQQSQA